MQYHKNTRRTIKHILAYTLIIVIVSGLIGYFFFDAVIEEPPVERLTLTWDSNREIVDKYEVFNGMHPQVSDMIKIQEVSPQDGDRQTASWTVEELGVAEWPQVCFRVRALNRHGTSDFSEAVCSPP
jgi:hypothetical protein